MKVTAKHLLVQDTRRGRMCVRADGLFQFVTEFFREPDDEYEGYWVNDPPSGIFGDFELAVAALRDQLASDAPLTPTKPLKIDLSVGPWPDPIVREP